MCGTICGSIHEEGGRVGRGEGGVGMMGWRHNVLCFAGRNCGFLDACPG